MERNRPILMRKKAGSTPSPANHTTSRMVVELIFESVQRLVGDRPTSGQTSPQDRPHAKVRDLLDIYLSTKAPTPGGAIVSFALFR